MKNQYRGDRLPKRGGLARKRRVVETSMHTMSQIFFFFLIFFPQKLHFLFHLKSSFLSQDIQIFVFPSFPFFLPVSHCFRAWSAWSKINLKLYDVINCLNKNLITHFVWYFKEEKRYGIETLSIKEHFYGKIMQKICTKNVHPDPFLFW